MPSRIAVITTSYPKDEADASGHFVQAEVSRLTSAGAHVEVFVPRGPAFGWPGVAARIRQHPARALGVPVALAKISKAFRAADPFERTIAHFAIPSAFPLALSARHRGALEIVSHGGDVRLLVALPRAIRRAAVGAMVERAEIWRFPSESLGCELAASLDEGARRALERIARVVPPAFDMPDIT
ncbi:MAG TPA: hypothetical protein VNO21_16495, partial [Polyangiaceae bacterium]|nr:hypothetical protein [Polyangiaceae bacterium]